MRKDNQHHNICHLFGKRAFVQRFTLTSNHLRARTRAKFECGRCGVAFVSVRRSTLQAT